MSARRGNAGRGRAGSFAASGEPHGSPDRPSDGATSRISDGPGEERSLQITALAAGGDGVGRDAGGRVTFVPRTAPGDLVRTRVVRATASYAHSELVAVEAPGPARVEPTCPYFARGCGGCAWQHVAHPAQLAAKQAIVDGALRKLAGLRVHPIADPAPALGWRRRARFHVARGRTGLYELGGRRIVSVDHCPQLEPALDAAYAEVCAAAPPDGELALLIAHDGRIAVATERAWPGAVRRIGRAGIAGVVAGGVVHGDAVLEIEPGLWGGPWDFAQASAAGNAALIATARAALGPGPGRLLELYAGAGNFTRGFAADGWDVTASDAVAPPRPPPGFVTGPAREVLARLTGPWDAIALDPPRTGAADAIAGVLRAAPRIVVYVSCDPATLARDAAQLTAGGHYAATDAWPLDVMPQTAHVEVVMRLQRA